VARAITERVAAEGWTARIKVVRFVMERRRLPTAIWSEGKELERVPQEWGRGGQEARQLAPQRLQKQLLPRTATKAEAEAVKTASK